MTGTPVGLVPAIQALRDNALKTVLAGQPVEVWATPDLVIVVAQTIRRTNEQRRQLVLAVHHRQSDHVLAIQVQQIEQEEDQRSLTRVGRVLDQVACPTIGQYPAQFTIKIGVLRRKPSNRLGDGGIFLGPVVDATVLDKVKVGDKIIQKQLARLPTRRELAGTALGVIFATIMLTTLSLLFFCGSG